MKRKESNKKSLTINDFLYPVLGNTLKCSVILLGHCCHDFLSVNVPDHSYSWSLNLVWVCVCVHVCVYLLVWAITSVYTDCHLIFINKPKRYSFSDLSQSGARGFCQRSHFHIFQCLVHKNSWMGFALKYIWQEYQTHFHRGPQQHNGYPQRASC